ncbi:hypothetical protein LSUE1_G006224 [Lachnellula suecica]|uniref:Rhodopsin domain-containing protein n=1 Tax=Lachnellula suecica TaxID=602035 RepID=A0A8T9BYP1_9HELO|nr:hypothetical protein LSUE1_G006224 [Lachnellula suecica]
MVTHLKIELAATFLYIPSIALSRLAILSMYMQVFGSHKIFRRTVYGLAGFFVGYTILIFFLTWRICMPFNYAWNKSVKGGSCFDIDAVYAWATLPTIISDLVILLMPFPMIWSLQLSRKQKMGLTFTFMTGSIGMIAALVKLIHVSKIPFTVDTSYRGSIVFCLDIAETGSYLIAACLPSLRPLWNVVLNSKHLNTLLLQYPTKRGSPTGSDDKSTTLQSIGGRSRVLHPEPAHLSEEMQPMFRDGDGTKIDSLSKRPTNTSRYMSTDSGLQNSGLAGPAVLKAVYYR